MNSFENSGFSSKRNMSVPVVMVNVLLLLYVAFGIFIVVLLAHYSSEYGKDKESKQKISEMLQMSLIPTLKATDIGIPSHVSGFAVSRMLIRKLDSKQSAADLVVYEVTLSGLYYQPTKVKNSKGGSFGMRETYETALIVNADISNPESPVLMSWRAYHSLNSFVRNWRKLYPRSIGDDGLKGYWFRVTPQCN